MPMSVPLKHRQLIFPTKAMSVGRIFGTVQTDEVAGAPVTPTLTPVSSLSLGNLVYKDLNNNGVFDGSDTGINGVALNLYADDGDGVLDAGDGVAIATATTAGGGRIPSSTSVPAITSSKRHPPTSTPAVRSMTTA